MRLSEKSAIIRTIGIGMLGALVLGLILACSLFNQLPVAQIAASVVSGISPLTVTFDATGSRDPDGTITAYVWNFGDGDVDTGTTVQHVFTTAEAVAVFTVRLTITDDDGATSEATQTIEVTANGGTDQGTGVPDARVSVDRFIGVDPMTVRFDASESTPGSGSITAYNWNFGDGGTDTGQTVTHTFRPDPEETTTYPATLFVWNSNGQLDTAQVEIIVIVPENDTGDEEPEADIFVTGPDLIYDAGEQVPNVPSLFEVQFDPRGSYADAGHSLEYFAWDFGDGTIVVETSDLEVTHIYELTAPTRTFVARLTVFDDQGLEGTAVVNVTLTQPEDEDD